MSAHAPMAAQITGKIALNSQSSRVPQLDGIRGCAILLVLVFHFVATSNVNRPVHDFVWYIARATRLSWSGVDLFFVLSGFLIGGILIDAKESENYFKTFYLRRVFRILPIYLLLVIPYLGICTVAQPARAAITNWVGAPMPWYVYLTFTQNFWLSHIREFIPYLAVSWSLAVEEQFYLLLPTIVRLTPKRRLLAMAAGLGAACAVARSLLYVHFGSSWGEAPYRLIYCRADALMLGVVCAILLRSARWKEFLTEKRWMLGTLAGGLGCGVALMTMRNWSVGTREMSTVGYTWMAMFYATLLLIAMVSPGGIWARILCTRWLMWLGSIAYGLYLIHITVAGVITRLLRPTAWSLSGPLDAMVLALAIAVSCALAQLSWKYFEAPLVKLGHRYRYGEPAIAEPPAPITVAAAGSAD